MNEAVLFIGVDIGTFETKAVLVNGLGQILARSAKPHGLSSPHPGWAEHDADDVWWGDFVYTVKELLQHPAAQTGTIAAVACSAIGPCTLPVDENLKPLRPGILYGVDTRSGPQIEQLNARLGVEEIFARTGNQLTTQSAGPKILWLKENEPEVYAKTRYYLSGHGYVIAKLTGAITMDYSTSGSYHPIFDLKTGGWDISGCEDFIRHEQLPKMGWSTEIAGTVTAEASAITGLPIGTPVTFGASDAPAEAVSAGVLDAGDLMLMYGSSSFMIQMFDAPVPDKILWSSPFVFEQSYVLSAGTSTAGTLTHWIADILGIGSADDPQARFAELLRLAEESPIGAKNLLMLPYFSGERTPHHDPEARGVLSGLTLSHQRSDIVRAALEGVAHSIVDALSRYEEIKQRPRTIRAVGGGTKNTIFIQTVSDLLNQEQIIADTPGASYGDAMLAALAVGYFTERSELAAWCQTGDTIRPNLDSRKILLPLHQDFKQLYSSTKDIIHNQYERDTTHGS
ncbi:MAG: FGGY-family carbohydrate kinase [Microbacteriaceae bacterium]